MIDTIENARTVRPSDSPRVAEDRTEHETLMALGFPAREHAGQIPRAAEPEHSRRDRNTRGRVRDALREFAAEERGAVTAEYTLVIVAGVAFAGVLIALMRSEEIRAALASLLQNALGSAI